MSVRKSVYFILANVCLFVGFCTITFAYQMEPVEHLDALAREYIQNHTVINDDEKLEVSLSDAARQLQLAKCDQPISVTAPASAAQQVSTLQMSCAGTQSWSAYVPVNMKILTKVVVAKETLAAKEVISNDMLDYAMYDKNSLYAGYFKDASEVAGQVPTTAMIAGTVITKKNIQKPIIINRNQTVSIVSRRGMIMVKAEGIAKTSGALNDIIRVLNPSSKRVIDAMVINSSSVEVR